MYVINVCQEDNRKENEHEKQLSLYSTMRVLGCDGQNICVGYISKYIQQNYTRIDQNTKLNKGRILCVACVFPLHWHYMGLKGCTHCAIKAVNEMYFNLLHILGILVIDLCSLILIMDTFFL